MSERPDAAEVARPSEEAQRVADAWMDDGSNCPHDCGQRVCECVRCLAILIDVYHHSRLSEREEDFKELARNREMRAVEPETDDWIVAKLKGEGKAFREAADLPKREMEK